MSEPSAQRHAFRVEGISVNTLSLPHAVAAMGAAARESRGFCAFTLNLDHCTKLRSDRQFRTAYRRARFVTADGFPIVLLGRLAGASVSRTTGADLAEPLCAEAARGGLPIVLFGPNARTLRFAQAKLRERIQGLEIADAFAPGLNFDPESQEADLAIERIRRSGARLCLVALGAPRQELFSARCVDMIPGMGFVCVGAALDFIAGTEMRAPPFFQNNGLEWLWRLSSNPRRLGLRYLRCAAAVPRLIADAIPQAVSSRRGRA
ncbi:MAG TPA: WecB/TagA/CpsF family glycosyltransferase [Pseudolabrys sp.]|nr:WecB/TagA/CpsF family glycosyltransferase [Pseudolabrys sp.]